MIGIETQGVERKLLSILRVLSDSHEPLGARVIARRLTDHGVDLGERAVRYHLKLMDERGLTRLVGRDGRVITELGIDELGDALVLPSVPTSIGTRAPVRFRLMSLFSRRINLTRHCRQ
jgi:repressor of nif and glnA expression